VALSEESTRRCMALLEGLVGAPVALETTIADSGLDSLTILEWFFCIEEEFNLRFEGDPAEGIKGNTTLGALLYKVAGRQLA
jgi:hypothetical protein